jgi:hypothetical protein
MVRVIYIDTHEDAHGSNGSSLAVGWWDDSDPVICARWNGPLEERSMPALKRVPRLVRTAQLPVRRDLALDIINDADRQFAKSFLSLNKRTPVAA